MFVRISLCLHAQAHQWLVPVAGVQRFPAVVAAVTIAESVRQELHFAIHYTAQEHYSCNLLLAFSLCAELWNNVVKTTSQKMAETKKHETDRRR